jgi:hypothetical protein
MAGLEGNIESFRTPEPKTAQEYASGYNQIDLQNQALQSGKMDNAAKALNFMSQALGSIGPNGTPQEYQRVGLEAVKQGLVPENTLHVWDNKIGHYIGPDGKFDSQGFYKEAQSSSATLRERLQIHNGVDVTSNDNQNANLGRQDVISGNVRNVASVPMQLAPGTSMPDTRRTLPDGKPNPDYLSPGMTAPPAGPSGFRPPSGLQGAVSGQPSNQPPMSPPIQPPAPASLRGAVARPLTTGVTGPTIERTDKDPTSFNNRYADAFPNTIRTGGAPGEASSMAAVAEQSGKDYATDLTRAKNFQAELYPAVRVLDILKQEGPKAFGQGTDALNTFKNAMVTWFPNVDPKTIQSVSNFEEAKKQMVALSRTSGNTGSNDQLAAAFEANPNTKMTGATIENVIKSVISLRKMQQAQTLLFGQQNLPDGQYSKWIAQNQNQLDPRAFGFDMMDDNAKNKLLSTMAHQDKDNNWIASKGKEKEFAKFDKSVSFAYDANLIEPPGRK